MLTDGDRVERRIQTVLLADVAGFTTLAEQLDPESVLDLLNRLFDHLVPCVQRYGGRVHTFIGDSFVALFDDRSAPSEHHSARAVRAALDMQAGVAAFNDRCGAALALHVGIGTGAVLAGLLHATGDGPDRSIMGAAINDALRLESSSASGEILIGAETHRLAGSAFTTELLGDISGGGGEDLMAYRVLGVRTT